MAATDNENTCTHPSVEELQGGQLERCRSCGKTWGGGSDIRN